MSRRALALLPLLASLAGLAVPASANVAMPFPCEPQPLVQSDSTGTYVVVRDPTQPCAYVRVRVPVTLSQPPTLTVAVAYPPEPCPPQALVQHDQYGDTVLVVRDPTKPCAYVRITVAAT